ncbi:hypothetical protein OOU_Y34scaffold00576g12 [Pyricularia oryzae Y34]|uniref:Uncharacterized protein n=2 Tax=Pyricularia oryzae TaxID=318829 RepID=A0AA97NWV2_PYRO3|nr:hypothetical protein OOU_Y34scaffold00576g12 [Pyricularia oryzae Y34]
MASRTWWVVQAGRPGVAQQERAPRAAASGKHLPASTETLEHSR